MHVHIYLTHAFGFGYRWNMLASRILPLKCDVVQANLHLHSILVCSSNTIATIYAYSMVWLFETVQNILLKTTDWTRWESKKSVVESNAFGRILCCRLFMIFPFFANNFPPFFCFCSVVHIGVSFVRSVLTFYYQYWKCAIEIFTRKRPHVEDELKKWQVFARVVCLLEMHFLKYFVCTWFHIQCSTYYLNLCSVHWI